MKARLDGFEIEGEWDELAPFMREYLHRRPANPALPPPAEKATPVRPKQVHRPDPTKPTKCDICGEEFTGRGYDNPYRVMKIHRAKRHAGVGDGYLWFRTEKVRS